MCWDARRILTRTFSPNRLNVRKIFAEVKLMMMINCVHSVSIDYVRYMYNASSFNESRHLSPQLSSKVAIQFRDESSSIFHSSILLFFSRPRENKLTYVLKHNILFITRDGTLRVVFHNLRHCHFLRFLRFACVVQSGKFY